MAPQASTKCGFLPPFTIRSLPAEATASIRDTFLAAPCLRSHRALHRHQHKAKKFSCFDSATPGTSDPLRKVHEGTIHFSPGNVVHELRMEARLG